MGCAQSLKRVGVGNHAHASATDVCEVWAIFALGPGVCARLPHVKTDFVSHPLPLGRPGQISILRCQVQNPVLRQRMSADLG